MPPARILPSAVRSGRTPAASWTPPGAQRKPVTTSSNTSSAPAASVSRRAVGEEPLGQRHGAPCRSRRLQDHRGDVPRVQRRREGLRIGRNDGHRAGDRAGQPGRVRLVERGVGAHGDLVVPAVEVPGQLDDPVPPGGRPGHPQRQQRRLGPARGEAHQLGGGDQPDHQFGPVALQFVARAGQEELARLRPDRRHHLGVAVPQQQRPVAHRVADELVAVEVPLAGALGPGDRERERLGQPDVVRDAARQQPSRPVVVRRGLRVLPRPAGDGTVIVLCSTVGRVARRHISHMAQSSRATPAAASPVRSDHGGGRR